MEKFSVYQHQSFPWFKYLLQIDEVKNALPFSASDQSDLWPLSLLLTTSPSGKPGNRPPNPPPCTATRATTQRLKTTVWVSSDEVQLKLLGGRSWTGGWSLITNQPDWFYCSQTEAHLLKSYSASMYKPISPSSVRLQNCFCPAASALLCVLFHASVFIFLLIFKFILFVLMCLYH